ncbi:hypothetical protein CSQ88_01620 [Iodobacter sp. BJB302]|nr:hypothetical protein CSQ88_01620 [Iodobacter sp. BJB302]
MLLLRLKSSRAFIWICNKDYKLLLNLHISYVFVMFMQNNQLAWSYITAVFKAFMPYRAGGFLCFLCRKYFCGHSASD